MIYDFGQCIKTNIFETNDINLTSIQLNIIKVFSTKKK